MALRCRLLVILAGLAFAPALLCVRTVGQVLTRPDDPGPRARAAVSAALAVECEHLSVTARGLAVAAQARGDSGLAGGDPAESWASCAPAGSTPARSQPAWLAARGEVRDRDGMISGYVYARRPLDGAFLGRLSTLSGARVRLRSPGEAEMVENADIVKLSGLALVVTPPARPGSGAVFGIELMAQAAAALVLAWVVARGLAAFVLARAEAGVAALEEALRRARTLSLTDPLTGLGNLRRLEESVPVEVERANRFGRTLGVLLLDLDHFKQVNDTYGHRAGDLVLVELARRIRLVTREVDLAFRHGGEEFTILLPETDVSGSRTAARRLAEAIRGTPFQVGTGATADIDVGGVPVSGAPVVGRQAGAGVTRTARTRLVEITVTVSIGVAVLPWHGSTGRAVLEAADAALYAAKAAGRDTEVVAGAV